MMALVRARFAAAAVAVVAAGLVAAPPQPGRSAATRVEVAAVQLQAAVATEVGAVIDVAGEIVPGADVPSASATGQQTLAALAGAVLAVALAPVWYVGFPVTLPLSVIGGIAMMQLVNYLPPFLGAGGTLDLLQVVGIGAVVGAVFFVTGPIIVGATAISSLLVPAAASGAASTITAPEPPTRAALPAEAAAVSAAEADRPARGRVQSRREAGARAAGAPRAAAASHAADTGVGDLTTETAAPAGPERGRAGKDRAGADRAPAAERGRRS